MKIELQPVYIIFFEMFGLELTNSTIFLTFDN